VPDARLKVFLTAAPEIRASRRAQETAADPLLVADAMARRDALDSGRDVSPLRAAPHAVVVDSSRLTQAEVVEHILQLARLVLS